MSNTIKVIFNNGRYMLDDRHLGLTMTVVKTCNEEDVKTLISQQTSDIPEGTELKLKSVFTNMFGTFVQAEYNNRMYDLYPWNLRLENDLCHGF